MVKAIADRSQKNFIEDKQLTITSSGLLMSFDTFPAQNFIHFNYMDSRQNTFHFF